MTKYERDILCPSCRDFDYAMNRQGGVSHDVFVVCECDWRPLDPDKVLREEKLCENIQRAKLIDNS